MWWLSGILACDRLDARHRTYHHTPPSSAITEIIINCFHHRQIHWPQCLLLWVFFSHQYSTLLLRSLPDDPVFVKLPVKKVRRPCCPDMHTLFLRGTSFRPT